MEDDNGLSRTDGNDERNAAATGDSAGESGDSRARDPAADDDVHTVCVSAVFRYDAAVSDGSCAKRHPAIHAENGIRR